MKVFVYGSNAQGIHGAGSAKEALNHGAIRGQTRRQGASYGISTKATPYRMLPWPTIAANVRDFLAHADANPQDEFHVVEIGCGLAGYTPVQMAPLFAGHPINVHLPQSFRDVLEKQS